MSTRLGEPKRAIGSSGDSTRPLFRRRDRERAKAPAGGEPPDRVGTAIVGKPERPVGSGGDVIRLAQDRVGELPDRAGSRDPPDLSRIGKRLRKPLRSVRPRCDLLRTAASCRDRELAKAAAGCHPPDLIGNNIVGTKLREPKCPVRSGSDPDRTAVSCRGRELGKAPAGRESSDVTGKRPLGEPERPVWPAGDPAKKARSWGHELTEAARGRNPPDLVCGWTRWAQLREPERSIRSGGDYARGRSGRKRELSNSAGCRGC